MTPNRHTSLFDGRASEFRCTGGISSWIEAAGRKTSVGLGQTKGCCSDGWMGQVTTTRAVISSFCSDAAAQNSDRFNIRPFSVGGAAVSCTPLARSLLRPPPPPFPQCAWRGLASNDHRVSREWHSGRQSGACAGTGA